MINLLPWNYHNSEPGTSKNAIYTPLSQEYSIVIWGNLLGKNNIEIEIDALLNSPKFIAYVEATRKDFVKNHDDLTKYPKLNESDWE